jgi:ABC-2 type transport system permease protein
VNGQRIRAVIRKDLRELTANTMVMIPMVVVPAVLCIIVPCVILVIALSVGKAPLNVEADQLAKLLVLYPVPDAFTAFVPRVLYVILNYTFVPYFMIVPLMMATLIAANAIVGEKERKTLETLLSTPITNREFIVAKLLGSFAPAVAMSWIAFVIFFAATNTLSSLFLGQMIVRSWIWLPALLLLSPAVSLLALSLTLMVSLKAKTFQAAQQIAALVVLPLIGVVVVQLTGIIILDVLRVVVLSIVLLVTGLLLVIRVLPRFTREGIISTL